MRPGRSSARERSAAARTLAAGGGGAAAAADRPGKSSARVAISAGPAAQDDDLEGVEDDGEVQEEGHVLHVVEVELQLPLAVLDRGAVAELDLGPAGDAGPHRVTLVVVRDHLAQLLDEVRALRARSHEAHLALEDVDDLGQLVEAELPQDAAEPGDPRVVLGPRPHRPRGRFGVDPHRAELVEVEDPPAQADPALAEERG